MELHIERELEELLTEIANKQNISVNQLVTSLLNVYVYDNPQMKHNFNDFQESTQRKRARKKMKKIFPEKYPDGFEVHHIDGNPNNNDINNLALVERSAHVNLHKILNESKRKLSH